MDSGNKETRGPNDENNDKNTTRQQRGRGNGGRVALGRGEEDELRRVCTLGIRLRATYLVTRQPGGGGGSGGRPGVSRRERHGRRARLPRRSAYR